MALEPGRQFGPYAIGEPIGSGGMGEVYRATDTNLRRDVAIKVLPESFAGDAERLARFQREAEVLASLNHSNIAQVFGLEQSDGATALVMELVEGPTLADRIAQGAIPVDEALEIAMQILDALEAAHARGVVHRDLKPANVKLRPDGTVKVLDFGIAKALDAHVGISGAEQPQFTTPAMTLAGVILGTAAYMAPEQARGRFVDQRADIWAFGCMLYEMLTGQPAFGGEDVTITLARVLERGADLGALPRSLPANVHRTIVLCLEKDPKLRLHHVGDVRLALRGAFAAEDDEPASGAGAGRRPGRVALIALAAALVTGALVWSVARRPPEPPQITRFVVHTPDGEPLSPTPVMLTPDGRDLVYLTGLEAPRKLYRQPLNSFEPRLIAGGERAAALFVSPREGSIGIAASGQLQSLDLDGGTPIRLASFNDYLGASWAEDGTFVLDDFWSAPLRIQRPGESATTPLTTIDSAAGEQAHLWPELLPDRRAVLFTIWSGDPSWDEAELAVADLDTGEHTVVLEGGVFGRYAPTGHLVFWRANALWAAPFDLASLTVTGQAVRVVPNVRMFIAPGSADYVISPNGTLAYVPGGADSFSESFLADRSGNVLRRLDDEVSAARPQFSPGGDRIAVTLLRGGTFAVGVIDLERGVMDQVFGSGDSSGPAWIDDTRLSFESNFDGDYRPYALKADGSGVPEPLIDEPPGFSGDTATWSADARHLVYVRQAAGNVGIWIHEPGSGTPSMPLIDTPFEELDPTISPDGRYIAYSSNETGVRRVYVRPFPEVDSRRITITTLEGREPAWSDDGASLYFITREGLMEVPVSRDENGEAAFGVASLALPMSGLIDFDVAPDGASFAIERFPLETAAREVHVIVNWLEELERLVPVK